MSARKAEYGLSAHLYFCVCIGAQAYDDSVIDLANHFNDGRLSAERIVSWSDEELEKNLTSVKGIGKVGQISKFPKRVTHKQYHNFILPTVDRLVSLLSLCNNSSWVLSASLGNSAHVCHFFASATGRPAGWGPRNTEGVVQFYTSPVRCDQNVITGSFAMGAQLPFPRRIRPRDHPARDDHPG